jgi:hypothetical protein
MGNGTFDECLLLPPALGNISVTVTLVPTPPPTQPTDNDAISEANQLLMMSAVQFVMLMLAPALLVLVM